MTMHTQHDNKLLVWTRLELTILAMVASIFKAFVLSFLRTPRADRSVLFSDCMPCLDILKSLNRSLLCEGLHAKGLPNGRAAHHDVNISIALHRDILTFFMLACRTGNAIRLLVRQRAVLGQGCDTLDQSLFQLVPKLCKTNMSIVSPSDSRLSHHSPYGRFDNPWDTWEVSNGGWHVMNTDAA